MSSTECEFQKSNKEHLYLQENLSVIVIGASGDLAKKKTFPALFDLYVDNYFSPNTRIFGYARSNKTDEEIHNTLRPFLAKRKQPEAKVEEFLKMVTYTAGQYNKPDDFNVLISKMNEFENVKGGASNRVYYFAIPPSVFIDVSTTIKQTGVSTSGWTRLILEKPFGTDLASSNKMAGELAVLFDESYCYRIDHYLGKEMVQNLLTMRFSNLFFEPLWNRNFIESVEIEFKEDIGTGGRGGYFDKVGIVRDIIQNHLLQVMALTAMEPPLHCDDGDSVRNEKVKLLKAVAPINFDDVYLGQYVAGKGEKGYLEDETVPKGSKCATFACVKLFVKNPRWDGVPFIFTAGKALDERKCEVRIKFKPVPGASQMFHTSDAEMPRNQITLRLQPGELIQLTTNIKAPGFQTKPVGTTLDLSYQARYDVKVPEAYTRLILDVFHGRQAAFVRSDELEAAWTIFTPLLEQIEASSRRPTDYVFGTSAVDVIKQIKASRK